MGEQPGRKVILNMQGVDYIDSTGLGAIVMGSTSIRNQGGAVKLLNLNRRNIELLVATKLATIFEATARKYVRDQVTDPELQEKLTPQYSLGCKRPGFHNTYLATYNRDNVTLETMSLR